jgi:hypothetical protein
MTVIERIKWPLNVFLLTESIEEFLSNEGWRPGERKCANPHRKGPAQPHFGPHFPSLKDRQVRDATFVCCSGSISQILFHIRSYVNHRGL